MTRDEIKAILKAEILRFVALNDILAKTIDRHQTAAEEVRANALCIAQLMDRFVQLEHLPHASQA